MPKVNSTSTQTHSKFTTAIRPNTSHSKPFIAPFKRFKLHFGQNTKVLTLFSIPQLRFRPRELHPKKAWSTCLKAIIQNQDNRYLHSYKNLTLIGFLYHSEPVIISKDSETGAIIGKGLFNGQYRQIILIETLPSTHRTDTANNSKDELSGLFESLSF